MHFENNDEFVTEDWRIWFKRLGAEATAGATAEMFWKSQRPTNYGRLFTKTCSKSRWNQILLQELSVNRWQVDKLAGG